MRWWWMNKQKIDQNRKALDRLEVKTENTILTAYQQSLREVRAILAEAYAKYDMEMFEMQKYKRLERLEKQLVEVINKLSTENTKTIKGHIGTTYEEAYYRQAFYTETELQLNLAYPVVKPAIIEKALNNKMTGLNWVERMGKNKDDTIYQIRQEIAKSLIQGESYKKMAKRLSDKLNIDANKAITIARTEGGRARSEATHDAMQHAVDKGVVMKKRWWSTLDERTRVSHRHMDGEVIEIDGTYSNGLRYPRDPMGSAEEVIRCRCEEIAEFEGFEPTERRIRGEGIVPYTTYKQWAEAKGMPIN